MSPRDREEHVADQTVSSSTRRTRVVIPTLPREDAPMTFSEAVRQCIKNLDEVKQSSPATLSNYDRTYQQYRAYLRGLGLADDTRHFTVETVSGFLGYLTKQGCVASTIHNKRHALSTLAKFMLKRKDGRGRALLTENPALLSEAPPESTPETKYLYEDEIDLLMAAPCSPQLALARLALADTWIRRQELVEANVGNFITEDDQHFLKIQVKGRRRKGEAPQMIAVSSYCAKQINAALATRGPRLRDVTRNSEVVPAVALNPDDPLFINEQRKRWTVSQLTNAMIRLGHKAGIRRITTSPHRLRHAGATRANADGVDPATLAAMLNHRGLRHVARYVHVSPKRHAAIREQQSAWLNKDTLRDNIASQQEDASAKSKRSKPAR
jgi:site-specific recombinase XerD